MVYSPITIQQLQPSFKADLRRSAVWGRTLSWQSGEKIRLVAPSGKGKTTLIQIIYGLRQDYAGTVQLGDRQVGTLRANDWAQVRREQLSIVFQDLRLFPHLSARENIQVKACLTDSMPDETLVQHAEALGIAQDLPRPCAELSQGELQRVAILRALAQPFSWLLLDEPFSHLDEQTAARAAALIFDACRQRHAGLIVTSLGADDLLQVDRELIL